MSGKGRSAQGRLLEQLKEYRALQQSLAAGSEDSGSFDASREALHSTARVDPPVAAAADDDTTVDAGRGAENSVTEYEDWPVLASEERAGAKSFINNSDSDMQLSSSAMEQQLAHLPAVAARGPRSGPQKYPTTWEVPEITFEVTPRAQNTDTTEFGITDTAQLSKVVRELGWSSVTAVVQRGTRFTSSNYSEHHAIGNIHIPPEEKHIYASIEVLKERIERLQRHNTDLQQHSEEKDNELVALRNQLSAFDRRPDSGFGAPEVDLEELREQKLKHEATMRTFNALQERNTAKRRTLEEALNKVTGERTDYMQQLARALSEIEELKTSQSYLQEHNAELRAQIETHVCKTTLDDPQDVRKKLAERITSYEYMPTEDHKSATPNRVTPSAYSIDFDGLPSDFTENLEYYMKGSGTKSSRPHQSDPLTQSRPSQGVSSAGDWPSAPMDDSAVLPDQSRLSQGVSSAGDWPSASRDVSAVYPEHSPAVLPHSMKAKVNGRFVRRSKYGYDVNNDEIKFNVDKDEIYSKKTRGSEKSEPAHNVQDEQPLRYGSRTISSTDWSDLDLRHNSAPRPPKHLRKWENWPKGIAERLYGRPLPTTCLTTDEEHESNAKDSRKESASTENAEGWTSFSAARSMSRGMDKVTANSFRPSDKATQQENNSQNLTGLSQALRDISNSEIVRSKLEEERKASREVDGASSKSPLQGFQPRKTSLKKVTIVSPHSSDEAEPQMTSGSYRSAKEDGATTDKSSGTQFHSFSGQKSLRDYQNTSEQESFEPSQRTPSASSIHSQAKRYERKSPAKDGETSAFIVPDITINRDGMSATYRPNEPKVTGWLNKQSKKEYYDDDEESEEDLNTPPPIPVTERSEVEDDDADLDIPDLDISCATVRPSQPPPKALAMVIKQIEDEVSHLKTKLASIQVAYARHDPSVGKRRRVALKQSMEQYEAEIEKRSEQVYALYDVLEGQKGQQF